MAGHKCKIILDFLDLHSAFDEGVGDMEEFLVPAPQSDQL